MINKKEIRALSLAGGLNFERSVHRRQALWESELAIRPIEPLLSEPGAVATGFFSTQRRGDAEFIKKMDPLQLVETDLSTTGISIGRHPMSFLREELNSEGFFPRRRMI